MNVDFVVHRAARADFVAWVRSLGRSTVERVAFAETYLDDLRSEFQAHEGRPLGVTRLAPRIESVWVWEYQARFMWILYQLRRIGGLWARLRGRPTLRVVILGFFSRPPTLEDLERRVREIRTKA